MGRGEKRGTKQDQTMTNSDRNLSCSLGVQHNRGSEQRAEEKPEPETENRRRYGGRLIVVCSGPQ